MQISEECQICQSGHVISPGLFINFGISGAAMHTCGIANPGTIVSVDSDPNASIFNVSNYGIVGDAMEVLSSLIEALKA